MRRALGAPRRLWRGSLRLRLTVASALLAAATFAAGGLLVLTLYHRTLVADQENTARSAASGIASSATRQALPIPIPMPVALTVPRIQVLGADNTVLTGDPTSVSNTAMLTLGPARTERRRVVDRPPFLPASRAFVIAIPVDGYGGATTVVAALSLDPADTKAAEAAELVALTCLGAIVVVIAVAWITAGRALRPVEVLRSEAERITRHGDLAQRLPTPTDSDELAQLGHTLNAMLSALDDATARQRRFVADAAHELRTPLAGITATLEVAHRHPATASYAQLVDDLLGAHLRLNSLVGDLLLLARIDAHAPQTRATVDVGAIVRACVAAGTRAGVATHVDVDELTRNLVVGEPAQIARIITNLLDNAGRHASSLVTVTVNSSDTDVVVRCADDGPGVPTADRERIFERFIRLDDSRSQAQGGTGLGLALVKELVEDHGGTVTVSDRLPAPGVVFTIRLPRRDDQNAEGTAASAGQP